MRTKPTAQYCLTIGAILALAGCAGDTSERRLVPFQYAQMNASKNIKAADLGDVPGGLMDPKSELVPLLGEGGNTFSATAIRDSIITTNVAEKKTCSVKSGTQLTIIAKNGVHLRVLADADCGSGPILVEGFIPLSDSKEAESNKKMVANSEPAANAPEQENNSDQVLVATQGNNAGAAAQQVNGQAATPKTYSGCSNVDVYLDNKSCGMDTAFHPVRSIRRSSGSGKPGLTSDSDIRCILPGPWFRKPASKDSFQLAVKGDAAKWMVKIEGQEHTVDASKYKTGDKQYRIRMKDVVSNNDAFREDVTWHVVALDDAGKTTGRECSYTARLVSPVVLDLANIGFFDGTGPATSGVKFDIAGKGVTTQTGWINPTMGLLALDKNSNGKIDDGTELFGEATELPNGKRSVNGYVALGQLDSNRDGMISAADAAFKNLTVWVDANSNGVTEKGELRSMNSLQIEKIGLAYAPSHRHGSAESLTNDVRYEARYWGPASCGTKGCLSFDVYFSTVQTLSLNRSK